MVNISNIHQKADVIIIVFSQNDNRKMNECNRSDIDDVKLSVGIVGGISCFLSQLACLFVLFIIVVYKKCSFSTQRLILYVTFVVFINVSGQFVQRMLFIIYHHIEDGSLAQITCQAMGFVSQYSAWGILMSISCFVVELIFGVFQYTESGFKMHIVYIGVIFVLPFFPNCIPFAISAYGATQWTCEIVTYNKSCEKFTAGIVMETLLWWVPLYATLIFAVFGYATITLKLLYDRKRYTAMIELDRNEMYKNTYDDILYLKYIPVLYMLINMLPIVSSIYDVFNPDNPSHHLWLVVAFIKGIQGGVIIILLVLDPKTRKRLTYKQLKAAFLYNVLRKEPAEEYPIITSSISDSLHQSSYTNNNSATE